MTEYGVDFFETIREGCRRSAEVVVPLFLQHYSPRSVVDVGCGEGWWAREFINAGISPVCGIDGPEADMGPVLHTVWDLAESFPEGLSSFDLAVCLEVAEHLPPERADSFVADLCGLAPVVLFSAAIPGQGGTGHLNEQWPAYWIERFEKNGFRVTGDFRRLIWNDDRIENWYRQNILVATSVPEQFPDLYFGEVLPIVHPVLFDARRS